MKKPKIKKVLSAKDLEQLSEMNEDVESKRWKTEELLIKHNLLDKVNDCKDMHSCPLCEKPFVDDALADLSLGRPIHSKCLGKLRKAKRT